MTEKKDNWPVVELQRVQGTSQPWLCFPDVTRETEEESYFPEEALLSDEVIDAVDVAANEILRGGAQSFGKTACLILLRAALTAIKEQS